MRHFCIKKLANSNLMWAYIESVIWVGLTRSKLLTFLNQSLPFVAGPYCH